MQNNQSPTTIAESIWTAAQCNPERIGLLEIQGSEPVLPSIHRVDAAAAATIGVASLAAAEVWHLKTGRLQRVSVDMAAAAATFRSERYLKVNGRPRPSQWEPLSGFYRAQDDRWVQLHCQFPHLRDGALRVLNCANNRAAAERAVQNWTGEALERETRAEGLCVSLVRTPQEWGDHPQAQAVETLPLIEIIRIGDAPPEPLPAGGDRPLFGIKALDLSRVIAGPVCGQTLASHGAQVMRVAGPRLPYFEQLVIATGLGKRSTYIDLRENSGRDQLMALAQSGDIFCQAYRPGSLAARGFSPEDLAAARPGIVYVTLSAYGHAGPWRNWRGYDSLVQSASGIAYEGGQAAGLDRPKHLPCQALDFGSGYLAAFGAMVALKRRAEEGGSWLVRVSLAQTAHWLDSLGRVDGMNVADPTPEARARFYDTKPSPFGEVSFVRPAGMLSETPARWELPPVPLGTHPPAWGEEF